MSPKELSAALVSSVSCDQEEDVATGNIAHVVYIITATNKEVSALQTIDISHHSEHTWAGSWNGHWRGEGWRTVFYNLLCSH